MDDEGKPFDRAAVQNDSVDSEAADYIARLRELTPEEETNLLNTLLTGGYTQGCFLRPKQADLIPNTPDVSESVLEALAERGRDDVDPTENDPYEYQALTDSAIPGVEPGFVILTQGCDVIRCLTAEPFVELAHVELVSDEKIIVAARRNSPRHIHVADGPTPDTAWVLDLRRHAHLAKDKLTDYPVIQAVAPGATAKRFKMRIGNRYSRDALPTELVEQLQKPVRDLFHQKAALKKAAAAFSDILVFREDGKILVQAVIAMGRDKKQSEDVWERIFNALPQGTQELLHDDSGAIETEQVGWWRYTNGWKLDVDDVSYGKKSAGHAPPTM